MSKPLIFIACDTNNTRRVKRIIKLSKTDQLDIGYKFGLEFFILGMVASLCRKLRMKKFFRS